MKLRPQEFPTHAASSVTSLAWDTHSTNTLFATGHADGSLHIFDRRLRPGAVFRTSEGHRSWVRGVRWQKRGRGELVSAAADGSVVVWDVRKAVPSVSVWVGDVGAGGVGGGAGRNLGMGMGVGGGGIGAMDVHDEANVILTCVFFPLSLSLIPNSRSLSHSRKLTSLISQTQNILTHHFVLLPFPNPLRRFHPALQPPSILTNAQASHPTPTPHRAFTSRRYFREHGAGVSSFPDDICEWRNGWDC